MSAKRLFDSMKRGHVAANLPARQSSLEPEAEPAPGGSCPRPAVGAMIPAENCGRGTHTVPPPGHSPEAGQPEMLPPLTSARSRPPASPRGGDGLGVTDQPRVRPRRR